MRVQGRQGRRGQKGFLFLLLLTLSFNSGEAWHTQPNQGRNSRRKFLQRSISTILVIPSVCQAQGEEEIQSRRQEKPFAPVTALLPAARCKLWIDRAHDLSSALSATSGDDYQKQSRLLADLSAVLSNRPNLFVNGEKLAKRTAKFSAQISTPVSRVNKEQWQSNRKSLDMPNQLQAMFNQADVERQWGMLQSSEAQREQANEIRAALNYYTQQLEFGDSYQLTAPKEDRKRMIRNDELPTLTAVITSDLDLRDLYRNQLLTALDDATAEARYQLKEQEERQTTVDVSDLVELMDEAYTSSSKWFAMIAPEDVQQAMEAVRQE